MVTSRLEEAAAAFIKESSSFASKLKLIDTFGRFSSRLPAQDPHLFSLYVTRNHPVQKIRHEDTFVGIGGAYRSKREVDGFIRCSELLDELASRPLTVQDIEEFNHQLSGKKDMPGAQLYSPKAAEVRKLRSEVVMYSGANPDDFKEGLAYITQLVNAPPLMHPLLHAALVHYLLVLLHPFEDGNGRTARMLTTLLMRQHGYRLGHEAYEQYYVWNSNQYQKSLDFRGSFYSAGMPASKAHSWMGYFTESMWKASQEYFQARMFCWIASLRARIPGMKKPIYDLICPAPAGTIFSLPRMYVQRYGPVGGKWKYTDADGNVIAWRVRFNGTARNKYEKSFLFFQYFSDGTWQYSPIQYKDVLPIYGLARIREGKNFLICEGEKCADAVRGVLGEHEYTLLSWATGALQVMQTDWALLGASKGTVHLWRDNDDIGKRAEDELAALLTGYGCKVYVLAENALTGKPKGWDAADAIKDGMTGDDIKRFIASNMRPWAANPPLSAAG